MDVWRLTSSLCTSVILSKDEGRLQKAQETEYGTPPADERDIQYSMLQFSESVQCSAFVRHWKWCITLLHANKNKGIGHQLISVWVCWDRKRKTNMNRIPSIIILTAVWNCLESDIGGGKNSDYGVKICSTMHSHRKKKKVQMHAPAVGSLWFAPFTEKGIVMDRHSSDTAACSEIITDKYISRKSTRYISSWLIC